IHLLPVPQTSRIMEPITPHGRPAGEQWWGVPGGSSSLPQVPVRPCGDERSPCRRTVPKTGAPRRFPSHYFELPEAKPASGPAPVVTTAMQAALPHERVVDHAGGIAGAVQRQEAYDVGVVALLNVSTSSLADASRRAMSSGPKLRGS